jgi:lysozyme family protein
MNFDKAFHELLGHEGGYSDHPDDPGGATMWGVTQRVARANGYTGRMQDLPVEVAKKIYKKDYWDAVQADTLPEDIRYAIFDAAVNSGPVQAIKWLQAVLGVEQVGVLGPKTKAALTANTKPLKAKYLGIRLRFMTDLRNWSSFSKGWARRIADLLIKD